MHHQRNRFAESVNNKRNNKKNAESSQWRACEKKKGCRYKNNNNNKKEKKTKLFGNQYSRLTEMVQDNHEVAEVLETAIEEERNLNINKEENTRNAYNVDSADMNALDAEMQKYAEQDNNEGIQNNINLNENIDDTGNKTEDKSEEEQQEYEECSEYHSEQEQLAWRLMNPDADSDSSDLDESAESNFELWCNNRVKCKYETYSE